MGVVLPVVVRTNHGIAIFAAALPPSEIASAVERMERGSSHAVAG